MYSPTLDEFLKFATQGNLIPVTRRILADLETPRLPPPQNPWRDKQPCQEAVAKTVPCYLQMFSSC
jgi:hypothetical protein